MHINFNRICKLAGVEQSEVKTLNEASNRSYHEDPALSKERETQFGKQLNEEAEADDEEVLDEEVLDKEVLDEEEEVEADDLDEEIEVDISELMHEIRRAKKIKKLRESRAQKANTKKDNQAIQEAHLKRIIQKEVDNILSEIEEHDSSWVYGGRNPRNSRKGHSAQGATIPSIGFKKRV